MAELSTEDLRYLATTVTDDRLTVDRRRQLVRLWLGARVQQRSLEESGKKIDKRALAHSVKRLRKEHKKKLAA